jgi:uncharacterized protein (DUF302 family)
MKKILLMCVLSLSLWANSVYTVTYDEDIAEVEASILESFKDVGLVVVWKLDILEEFKKKGLDKKFGEKFNTAGLTGVRTIVACNGKFGNDIINADSDMMAFCPIRVTMTEKDGKTTVLYVRPSVGPKESKAHPILVKLEKKVINAIESGMK